MPATAPRTPRGRQRSGACELEQQDLVGATAPVLLRPSRQMTAGEQPRLVVVRAEIGRAGMRNVDGDDRNAAPGDRRTAIAGATASSVWNSMTRSTPSRISSSRVAERDLRLIAVVDDDQLDLRSLGGAHQAAVNLARERAVLPLRRISDPVLLAPPDLRRQAVAVVFDLLDESAVAKRVEQAEAHALRRSRCGP